METPGSIRSCRGSVSDTEVGSMIRSPSSVKLLSSESESESLSSDESRW